MRLSRQRYQVENLRPQENSRRSLRDRPGPQRNRNHEKVRPS